MNESMTCIKTISGHSLIMYLFVLFFSTINCPILLGQTEMKSDSVATEQSLNETEVETDYDATNSNEGVKSKVRERYGITGHLIVTEKTLSAFEPNSEETQDFIDIASNNLIK